MPGKIARQDCPAERRGQRRGLPTPHCCTGCTWCTGACPARPGPARCPGKKGRKNDINLVNGASGDVCAFTQSISRASDPVSEKPLRRSDKRLRQILCNGSSAGVGCLMSLLPRPGPLVGPPPYLPPGGRQRPPDWVTRTRPGGLGWGARRQAQMRLGTPRAQGHGPGPAPVRAESPVRADQAACRYWWITPPGRSCRCAARRSIRSASRGQGSSRRVLPRRGRGECGARV